MQSEAVDQGTRFRFVESLAKDLSDGSIELPSFPDVVIRLRQVLEDERSTSAQIIQLLAAEPALAAWLLQIANCAALRPGSTQITDLNMVINRLGRDMVRNSAMSFALKQMREAQKLEAAQPYLEALWAESTRIAALCYVLAKNFTRLNPDEALLVGLLHGTGKLYILAQAESYPDLFQNESDLQDVLRDWHTAIGSAILESWNLSEEVSSSVANYQEVDRDHDGPTDLTDVLIVANILSAFFQGECDTELQLEGIPASRHLAVSAEDLISVLQEFEERISALNRALGK